MKGSKEQTATERIIPGRREEERQLSVEAASLSTERILEPESVTTRTLSQLLERGTRDHYPSHWGINE